jgi:hypothetical protein
VNSAKAILSLGGVPVIITQPVDGNTTVGNSISFAVEANGEPPLTFQWKKDGINISGATDANHTIASAQLTDSGIYRVIVTNLAGSTTSRSARLVVGEVPAFTLHPVDLNSTAGQSLWIMVHARGSKPLNYQWLKDGVNLPTTSSFTIAQTFPAFSRNGKNWLRDTDGGWCFVTPAGKLVRRGISTDLNASVWENPSQLIGTNFLFIRKANATHSGTYRCVAGNDFGNDTSTAAVINVEAPPEFTLHPANLSLNLDANGTLRAEASGQNITYQWRKDGASIAGATAKDYALTNAQATDAGTYVCVATNPNGSVNSQPAVVTLLAPPLIILQPVDQNASANDSVVFSTRAHGLGPLTFQWQKNGANIADGVGFKLTEYLPKYDSAGRKWLREEGGGLTYLTPQGTLVRQRQHIDFNASVWANPSLIIGPNYFAISKATGADAGAYRCIVSNAHGNATSRTASLGLISPPVISAQPADAAVELNGTATFTVTVNGTGLTYQWQKDSQNISGGTAATLTLANVTLADADQYRCVVSNLHGTIQSEAATLTISIPPAILVHPVSQNATANDAITFSVTTEGTGTLSYQWQKDGVDIAGGTGFTITQHLAQFTGLNRKWLKDGNGHWCYLTPAGTLVRRGARTDFNASVWADPTLLIGPNFFTIPKATSADAGTYRCRVSNPQGSTASNGAVLTLIAPPLITSQPADLSVV